MNETDSSNKSLAVADLDGATLPGGGPDGEDAFRPRSFDGKTCPECGRTMLGGPDHAARNPTTDHIVPRARGGSGDPSNLRVVCRSCNSRKGDR